MRILLIGGTRFIGPAVARQLHEQGHTVAIFHRGQTRAQLPQGVAEILGERSQLANYRADFVRFAPAVIIDMFPFVEQDAISVMSTFKGIAQRVVALSSGDVYRAYARVIGTEPGPADPVPLSEDAPLRERLYPYRGERLRSQDDPTRWMDDYDKILIERVVMSDADSPGTILRLPVVYGPGDNQHRCFTYLKRMDDQRPAILLNESLAQWRWTRSYVENVAAAIVLAAIDERARGRIYNVGEADTVTIAEWVRQIGAVAGWHGHIIAVPDERLPEHLSLRVGANQHILVDTTRIRSELGYSEPVPLDAALERTVAWERANPPQEVDAQQFDYATEDAVLASMG
ncbi:MAG TPA: NAD-dependent epimerase/dehydratase family protein [Ktedonobacteraceae bacterium]|jgi:nucleoside-diphosphate-sugar epimerase|nr:NAD-dependent epimerase/dehydratase family protein [Ktedonobacteraceae bacterium]